jgi:disulfide bond formation protein DsbB
MNGVRFIARWWVLFAVVAAAAMLAAAHGFERFGGLAPCHLCYKQRDVYWYALALGVPAAAWALFTRSKGTPRLASFLLFAVFAVGAIVATYHAGAELHWWKGPSTCTGGGDSVDVAAMKAILGGAKVKPPQCDVIAWSFGGLSMAGWNAVVSVLLSGISLVSSMRRKDIFRAR